MTTKFELRTWLSENRELVIISYNELAQEKFFNSITLKDYMVKVMQVMQINNPRSAKRAADLLPNVMGRIYFNNSTVEAFDAVTERLRKLNEGKASMALV